MQLDMADVKPTVLSFLVVMAFVIVGVPLLKAAMQRWPIPGLSVLVAAI
jgi:hypothetical protein